MSLPQLPDSVVLEVRRITSGVGDDSRWYYRKNGKTLASITVVRPLNGRFGLEVFLSQGLAGSEKQDVFELCSADLKRFLELVGSKTLVPAKR